MSLILAFYMLFALGRALGSMIRSFRQQDTSGPVVVADASDDDHDKNFRLRLDIPFLGGPGFGDGGDILCFLATGEEIDAAVRMAEDALSSSAAAAATSSTGDKKGGRRRRRRGADASCLPLYSSLPARVQSQVFLPRSADEIREGKRRIIFATNVAEASVTVPDIAHVIDCGYAKMPFFDPLSGFERLVVCPISRASANQRDGQGGEGTSRTMLSAVLRA